MRLLDQLVEHVEASSWFRHLSIKVGGRGGSIDDVRRELRAVATAIGERHESSQKDAGRAQSRGERRPPPRRRRPPEEPPAQQEFGGDPRWRGHRAPTSSPEDESVACFHHWSAALGFPHPTSAIELDATWRKLAFRLHPDRHGNTPAANAVFRVVKEGFEILKEAFET